MIKTKEDLLNTYIKNDYGSLRDKYVKACITAGYKHQGDNQIPEEYKLDYLSINPSYLRTEDGGIGQSFSLSRTLSQCKQLTLEDFEEAPTPEQEEIMISKEKIENGYIVNDQGELRRKFAEAALKYGYQLPIKGAGDLGWLDFRKVFICREGYLNTGNSVMGKVELTLEDFESEQENGELPNPKEDFNVSVCKYKYTLVDMSPEEIYRAMLDGETFYEEDGTFELYFDGIQFVNKDTTVGACISIKGIDNDNQICRREEVKWQDEVIRFLGCCKDKVGNFDITVNSEYSRSLANEDFLEMCRVVLRTNGEFQL